MDNETFVSVFDALADTKGEAASLQARAELLLSIRDHIAGWDRPDAEVADRLGLSPTRLDDLREGRLGAFALEELIDVAAAADLTVEISVRETA